MPFIHEESKDITFNSEMLNGFGGLLATVGLTVGTPLGTDIGELAGCEL